MVRDPILGQSMKPYKHLKICDLYRTHERTSAEFNGSVFPVYILLMNIFNLVKVVPSTSFIPMRTCSSLLDTAAALLVSYKFYRI